MYNSGNILFIINLSASLPESHLPGRRVALLAGAARLILEPEVPLSHVHCGAFAGIAAAPLARGVGTIREAKMAVLFSVLSRPKRAWQYWRKPIHRSNDATRGRPIPLKPPSSAPSRASYRHASLLKFGPVPKVGTRTNAVKCSSRAKAFIPSSSRSTPARLQQEQTSAAPLDQPPL